jgi:hypothetical protein|tara:strand:+ start:535 stop:720 length:186 start_codon:yes stop_codon:yes gene_type:complete
MEYFPPIDERLVAALAAKFPDRCPDLQTEDKQVWFNAGRADVVRWLALKLEEQNNVELEGL